MRTKIQLTAFRILFAATSRALSAVELHVDPSGNDGKHGGSVMNLRVIYPLALRSDRHRRSNS
jgi:hypothetical protein